MRTKGYKIKKKDIVITQCVYCNKPFSFDKNKGWPFMDMCRECVKNKRNSFPMYVSDLDNIHVGLTDMLLLSFTEMDEEGK